MFNKCSKIYLSSYRLLATGGSLVYLIAWFRFVHVVQFRAYNVHVVQFRAYNVHVVQFRAYNVHVVQFLSFSISLCPLLSSSLHHLLLHIPSPLCTLFSPPLSHLYAGGLHNQLQIWFLFLFYSFYLYMHCTVGYHCNSVPIQCTHSKSCYSASFLVSSSRLVFCL